MLVVMTMNKWVNKWFRDFDNVEWKDYEQVDQYAFDPWMNEKWMAEWMKKLLALNKRVYEWVGMHHVFFRCFREYRSNKPAVKHNNMISPAPVDPTTTANSPHSKINIVSGKSKRDITTPLPPLPPKSSSSSSSSLDTQLDHGEQMIPDIYMYLHIYEIQSYVICVLCGQYNTQFIWIKKMQV